MDVFFLASFWGLWYLTFLPGFVLLRLIGYRSSLFLDTIASFGMSLLLNYTIVFIATAFHIPLTPVLWTVSFIAFLLMLWVWLGREQSFFAENTMRILTSFGILFFLWFLNQFVARSGSIPWAGDDLFGWHSWALQWFTGHGVFTQPNFYPQMLPITWASSYTFSGTPTMFFFSRSLMPFFFFGIFLATMGVWWQQRLPRFFFGLVSLGWLFVIWRHFPRMTMGLADIPATFLAISSFALLSEYRLKKTPPSLVVAILLATASALTKQYGMVYCGGFFLIVGILLLQRDSFVRTRSFWVVTLLALVLLASWYGYGFFAQGYHRSLVRLFSTGPFEVYSSNPVVNTHSASVVDNLFKSTLFLMQQFRHPVFFVLMVLFSAIGSVVFPEVALLIVLPAFILWGELIAYDIRNFSIGLVFFLYLGGVGIGWSIEQAAKRLPTLDHLVSTLSGLVTRLLTTAYTLFRRSLLPASILTAVILIICSFVFSRSYLFAEQNRRMKRYVGNYREVNAMLYTYLDSHPDTVVYTDYPFIRYMPDLTYVENAFTNLSHIQTVLKTNTRVVFLVIFTNAYPSSRFSEEVREFFSTNTGLRQAMAIDKAALIEKVR